MKTKYTLKYEWDEIAEVEIDEALAAAVIREMIEFTQGDIEEDNYDPSECLNQWLKWLGLFILRNERAPESVPEDGHGGDEGWVKMDGSYGIKILSVIPHEFDADQIEIEGAEVEP